MTRYAVYWAPPEGSALWRAGAAWLGRDPAGAAIPTETPDLPGLDEITRDPARYGLHATLKPPMRLREGAQWDDLLASCRVVAREVPAFDMPPLAVTSLDGFLCLRETRESVALQACCDAFVAGLDPLRAASEPEELARRRAAGLNGAQEANLMRWGYPYVFATWFFHVTLSRRLSAAEQAVALPAASAWFAPSLARAFLVTDVCLFVEPAPRTPFVLAARVPLAG